MTAPYMPVQPVNFFIPPDIQAGLAAGDLARYGGVIRNPLGRIVTHLKEVPVPGKEPAAAQRVISLLSGRCVITVIAATGGVVAALAVKNQVQARTCAKDLNASLVAYLKAARDGALDKGAISRLISALDAAEAYSRNGQVAVASELVGLLMDYTAKFAEANSVELEEVVPASEGGKVDDLRHRLEAQRKIFTEAA